MSRLHRKPRSVLGFSACALSNTQHIFNNVRERETLTHAHYKDSSCSSIRTFLLKVMSDRMSLFSFKLYRWVYFNLLTQALLNSSVLLFLFSQKVVLHCNQPNQRSCKPHLNYISWYFSVSNKMYI